MWEDKDNTQIIISTHSELLHLQVTNPMRQLLHTLCFCLMRKIDLNKKIILEMNTFNSTPTLAEIGFGTLHKHEEYMEAVHNNKECPEWELRKQGSTIRNIIALIY